VPRQQWLTTDIIDVAQAEDDLAKLAGRRWLCRGQDADYGALTPSIDRDGLNSLSRLAKLKLERQSIDLFRLTAHSVGPGEEQTYVDDGVALAVLRHYGVPTRVLDWSMSPYVVAYFAACGSAVTDGELWSFDHDRYAERGKKQWNPLADGFPLPLAHRGQDVQDQASRGAAGVDLLAHREQRSLAGREVAVDQRSQVHHVPGEPVQLYHEQRLGLARLQHSQRALQAWTVEGLRALAGVDDDLDQIQLVQLGVGLQLGALRIEAHASVSLLVGRDSQVGDGLGRHESDLRSLAGRVKHPRAKAQ
jgi:FRG domain